MKSDELEIREALRQLVGLKLAAARRAADMRVFHFGTLRPAPQSGLRALKDRPRGSIGDFAIHVQCPWRIETDEGIVTGRSDLWEPLEPFGWSSYDQWDYERDGNLQDQLIEQWFSKSNDMIVTNVNTYSNAMFTLTFTGGYRLVVFPSGSAGESWRLFPSGADDAHLVVSGGAIERGDR